jgi:iron complex transport system substrate-binding protein
MPYASNTAHLSRRGLLAAGGAALGALLTACGGSRSSGSASVADSGPWTFTDGRAKTVTTRTTPSRIVAFTGTAAALVDFGLEKKIVGVFGETRLANGAAASQAGELDIDKVTILGNVWGEFNVEKYAALNPDLLVTHTYGDDALWYVPDESKDKILKLAPSVAISVGKVPLPEPIKRYAELAESLGADLKAKQVTDAKARFDAAGETLRQAAKATGGLTVMAASGSADVLYVSNPRMSSDLMHFADLGVDLVVPTKLDKGAYFESLSWENADKYAADLIILDNRSTALQPADLAAKPAWAALPAVRAGQVAGWDPVPRFSYAGSAPLLQNLAKSIQDAKKIG